MTPRLARNQMNRIAIRRRNTSSGLGLYRRRFGVKKNLKKLTGPTRMAQPSIAACPASSWILSSASWTDMKIVEMTNSEICSEEFASWTIFDDEDQCDFGNDNFLGECMRLVSVWKWCAEMEEDSDSSVSATSVCGSWSCPCSVEAEYEEQKEEWIEEEEMDEEEEEMEEDSSCDSDCCECWRDENEEEEEEEEEESTDTYSDSTVSACYSSCCRDEGVEIGEEIEEYITAIPMNIDEEEEIMVEPETHDSLLMAALLSTKDLLPASAGGLIRALSCPDLLMDSLAALLFETRHLHFINERSALPSPPTWMIEAAKEMDPPNSLVTTVSLPSGWETVSARLSSSSIFNLFSDRPASPIPSLFSIDPTGAPSTASTVSVPLSFWDTPSTASMTGSLPLPSEMESSLVSIPSTFFLPQPLPSSTSSLFIDPSEVSSSSSSSLFMDPSSAHSSGCSSSSHMDSLSSSSITSYDLCSDCGCAHAAVETSSQVSTDNFERSRHTYIVSSPSSTSSGYESDVDESVVLKKSTVSASTQTSGINQATAIRMLAECDSMLEKLVEMKKKLMEFM